MSLLHELLAPCFPNPFGNLPRKRPQHPHFKVAWGDLYGLSKPFSGNFDPCSVVKNYVSGTIEGSSKDSSEGHLTARIVKLAGLARLILQSVCADGLNDLSHNLWLLKGLGSYIFPLEDTERWNFQRYFTTAFSVRDNILKFSCSFKDLKSILSVMKDFKRTRAFKRRILRHFSTDSHTDARHFGHGPFMRKPLR